MLVSTCPTISGGSLGRHEGNSPRYNPSNPVVNQKIMGEHLPPFQDGGCVCAVPCLAPGVRSHESMQACPQVTKQGNTASV